MAGNYSPVHGEDMFEVYASVDDHPQAVSEQGRILTVQYDTTVDDVEEQQQILGPVEWTCHQGEHCVHQLWEYIDK